MPIVIIKDGDRETICEEVVSQNEDPDWMIHDAMHQAVAKGIIDDPALTGLYFEIRPSPAGDRTVA